jgi:signal transduction histidine kinase
MRVVFGDHRLMLHLEVPRRATINESPQLARLVLEAEREKGPVEFDCGKTEVWGPFGVALLASCVAVRQKQGRVTQLLEPKGVGVALSAFEETGLAAMAGEGIAAATAGQVRALDWSSEVPHQELANELAHPSIPGSVGASSLLESCLDALLENLYLWSESTVGAFVVVKWLKKGHRAKVALVDRGVGIPAALRRALTSPLHRALDVDVVEAAFSDPHVTSHEGQLGHGLKTLRETVLSHRGKLTVVSLGAKVSWSAEKLTKATSPALRGTAIELEVSE